MEEAVRDQYKSMDDSQNNILVLREKINNFDRFLEVYSQKPLYKEQIDKFYAELERMILDEEKISFYQAEILDMLIDIIAKVKGITIDNLSDNLARLRSLNIIPEEEMLETIRGYASNLNDIENYLKGIGKIELVPIIKAVFICSSEHAEELENINMYWNYVSNVFIAYLELAGMLRENIMEQYVLLSLNLQDYIEGIIKNYESKINFKYIPSSVLKLESYDFLENGEVEEETEILRFIDVNEKYKKIKLIGYAGVGKTTTLEYIEYQDALNFEANKKIPVILSLITVNELVSIETLICRKLKIEEENEAVVKYLLKKNRINLYLDGINEISIADADKKREFISRLEDFINKKENKDLKVIVTDRDNDAVSVLNNRYTFLIQGMNENDIDEFIQGNAKKEKVSEIKQAITQNEEIFEAVTHPFMLKNIITIIECGKKIPKNIEELADVYLDSIIVREIEEKKDEYARYINELLKYLVKKVVETDTDVANPPITHFELIPIFYDFADSNHIENFDADRMLDLLIKMGILREVEFEKYTFSDEQFFQKYYNDIIEGID